MATLKLRIDVMHPRAYIALTLLGYSIGNPRWLARFAFDVCVRVRSAAAPLTIAV